MHGPLRTATRAELVASTIGQYMWGISLDIVVQCSKSKHSLMIFGKHTNSFLLSIGIVNENLVSVLY